MNDLNKTLVFTGASTLYSDKIQMPDSLDDVLSVVADVQAITGTTPSLAITVQGSDDGVTFTDLNLLLTMTTVTVSRKTTRQNRQWLRLKAVLTGTTPTATVRLSTRVLDSEATASDSEAWLSFASTAFERLRVIKASSGTLREVFGWSKSTTALCIGVFDAAAEPSALAVPLFSTIVRAGSAAAPEPFSVDLGSDAWPTSSAGLVVAAYTVGATYAAIVATDCVFYGRYR